MNIFSTAVLGRHVFGEHHFLARAERGGWNPDTERRPRYLKALEVSAASQALEHVTPDVLLRHYDLERMKSEVYWGAYLSRSDIISVFEAFRAFYRSASKHREAVLVTIG